MARTFQPDLRTSMLPKDVSVLWNFGPLPSSKYESRIWMQPEDKNVYSLASRNKAFFGTRSHCTWCHANNSWRRASVSSDHAASDLLAYKIPLTIRARPRPLLRMRICMAYGTARRRTAPSGGHGARRWTPRTPAGRRRVRGPIAFGVGDRSQDTPDFCSEKDHSLFIHQGEIEKAQLTMTHRNTCRWCSCW